MGAVVADTHVLLWYLLEPNRLSQAASDALEHAVSAGGTIFIPSISLVEIVYLVEKRRLPELVLQRLDAVISNADSEVAVVPLGLDVAQALRRIPRDVVPDMPDRIIAATALHLNLPLVSRDRKIQAAQIKTVW